MSLTVEMKDFLRGMGADLIGVAPVERFEGAPTLPQEILPGAKNVIVIGMRVPIAATEVWKSYKKPYQVYGHGWLNYQLSFMEYNAVRLLEDEGYRALPLSSMDPYYNIDTFVTDCLSNRHAAAAAGLGTFGWSNLLLTPEFGPRQRFTCVITDADLEADPMYDKDLCGSKCKMCIEACPMNVLDTEEETRISIAGVDYVMAHLDYEKKYLCRWCEHGLTNRGGALTEIPITEMTSDAYLEAWNNRHKYQARRQGMFGGIWFCGRCVQVCPVGKKKQLKRKESTA